MASVDSLAREFGVRDLLEAQQYTAALERLIPILYPDGGAPDPRAVALREAILTELREAMRTASHPPRHRMKFGTSGWRGLLYEDFTVRNVACVTQGLIDTLLDPRTHAALGVASAEEIDRCAREMLAPRMCITGLIEQKDISGLDTHALAQRALVPVLHHGDKPRRALQDLYEAGHLGIKTGKGFYDWSGKDPGEVKAEARSAAISYDLERRPATDKR